MEGKHSRRTYETSSSVVGYNANRSTMTKKRRLRVRRTELVIVIFVMAAVAKTLPCTLGVPLLLRQGWKMQNHCMSVRKHSLSSQHPVNICEISSSCIDTIRSPWFDRRRPSDRIFYPPLETAAVAYGNHDNSNTAHCQDDSSCNQRVKRTTTLGNWWVGYKSGLAHVHENFLRLLWMYSSRQVFTIVTGTLLIAFSRSNALTQKILWKVAGTVKAIGTISSLYPRAVGTICIRAPLLLLQKAFFIVTRNRNPIALPFFATLASNKLYQKIAVDCIGRPIWDGIVFRFLLYHLPLRLMKFFQSQMKKDEARPGAATWRYGEDEEGAAAAAVHEAWTVITSLLYACSYIRPVSEVNLSELDLPKEKETAFFLVLAVTMTRSLYTMNRELFAPVFLEEGLAASIGANMLLNITLRFPFIAIPAQLLLRRYSLRKEAMEQKYC